MMYQETRSYLSFASAIKLKTLLFLLWISVLAPLTASAVVVEGLFDVKMTVLDESKEIRRAALDDGLIEVLIRISGDSNILEKITAPAANGYVKRYEYSIQPSEEKDVAPLKQLWARYNTTKIMSFLRQQAIPVWGDRRTRAVVWLAVNDGKQRYVLKNKDISLIKSKANEAFNRRGVPTIWPENDALDKQTVHFSDIWAGFIDPLKKASERYASGPVVVAKMVWSGSEWKSEWSLLMDGNVRKWSLTGSDYANQIARATDLLVDAMGQKFAVLETSDISQQKTVSIEVDRVGSAEAFRRVEKYLLSLSAVRSVQLSQVEPDRVFFDLTLRSEVDDILNLIQSGSVMTLLADDVINESKDESKDASNGELKDKTIIKGMTENPTKNTSASVPTEASIIKPMVYRFALR